MTRIDIDLLRYGSRGAVYRVTYDSRMLIAESRVPASDAARGAAGREFSRTRHANDRRFLVRGIRTNPECAAGHSNADGWDQRGRSFGAGNKGVVCVLSKMEEQP